MTTLIFILMLVAVIAFIVLVRKSRNEKTAASNVAKKIGQPPYFKKKTLLNETEQILFLRLIEALPNCFVLAQVRLADIVGVKNCDSRQTWFNKIQSKSVDFVICNKSFVVLVCIELDGKTHEDEDRQKADNEKDLALKTAGIPILRIAASNIPSVEEIKTLLEKAVLH